MGLFKLRFLGISATSKILGRKTAGAGGTEELTAADVRTILNVADGANVGLPLAGGALSGALNEAQGANIASGTNIDIGAGTGNSLTVTGTTTIVSLGTVQAGTRRKVTFSGILILTYNATSLILPTSANITTQAGDVVEFISLGGGNWVCTSYQRKDGTALVPNALSSGIGLTTRAMNTASGTQNIAHGLGRTPTWVKIRVQCLFTTLADSDGGYDGTDNACIWTDGDTATGTNATYAIWMQKSSGDIQKAIITVDSTNIILTWTKVGLPTGTANIFWMAL